MRRVTHREMRNSSGEILRAVAEGETVEVTNNGRVAALIVPPPRDPVEELIASGRARRPANGRSAISGIERVRLEATTQDVLDDLRKSY